MVQQMQEIELNEDNIPSMYILNSKWNTINEGLTVVVNNSTILVHKLNITEEKCNNLAKGITDNTACVVSDRSFNPNSLIGPAGTSTVNLVSTDTSEKINE